MKYKIWVKYYDLWEKECRQELYEKGYEEEEINLAEICENGQVKFHGGLYHITNNGYVTPWEKSKHYKV